MRIKLKIRQGITSDSVYTILQQDTGDFYPHQLVVLKEELRNLESFYYKANDEDQQFLQLFITLQD